MILRNRKEKTDPLEDRQIIPTPQTTTMVIQVQDRKPVIHPLKHWIKEVGHRIALSYLMY